MTAAKKQPAKPAAKKPVALGAMPDPPKAGPAFQPPAGTRLDPATNELVADD